MPLGEWPKRRFLSGALALLIQFDATATIHKSRETLERWRYQITQREDVTVRLSTVGTRLEAYAMAQQQRGLYPGYRRRRLNASKAFSTALQRHLFTSLSSLPSRPASQRTKSLRDTLEFEAHHADFSVDVAQPN